jgi:hypothetical protein
MENVSTLVYPHAYCSFFAIPLLQRRNAIVRKKHVVVILFITLATLTSQADMVASQLSALADISKTAVVLYVYAFHVLVQDMLHSFFTCLSEWPRGLRHESSSPTRTLGSWVRIPLEAWMSLCVYSVFISFCV